MCLEKSLQLPPLAVHGQGMQCVSRAVELKYLCRYVDTYSQDRPLDHPFRFVETYLLTISSDDYLMRNSLGMSLASDIK